MMPLLRMVARWTLASRMRLCTVVFVVFILAIVAFGPLLSPYSTTAINASERFLRPSWSHPFGTDEMGRDIITRVLAGARLSVLISASVLSVTLIVGVVVGGVAGFYGGLVDLVVMRITEIFLTFPTLVLAMALAASLGPSLGSMILALSIAWWASYARLLRAKVIELREEQYVEAARALGMSSWRVLFRHILPNALGPLVVRITNDFGGVILFSTVLGFLGLGPQPPTPEWGLMVATASRYLAITPSYALFSGSALFITVLAFALLGDEVYESYRSTTRRD